MSRISSTLLAVSLLLGPGIALASEAADQVAVSGAYVRAVPPGQMNSAAFLALTNTSGEAHALVAAESDAADALELHSHTMEDGMMKMRRIERIDVPAAGTLSLEPGGLHLMLIGLKRQLAPGQEIKLFLTFEDGSRAQVDTPVRRIAASAGGRTPERKCGDGRCGSGK